MLKVEQNKKQAKRETIVCFCCVWSIGVAWRGRVGKRGEVERGGEGEHPAPAGLPRSGQVSVLVLLASVRSE